MSYAAHVAAAIQAAPAKSIYVVGTGDLSTTTMTQWAAASGNPPISLVSLTPAQAAATLKASLDGIQTSSISCSFAIPEPSGLAAIDYSKLNLSYVAGSGSVQNLRGTSSGAAATCSGTTLGWYYDNPAAPQAINLCSSTYNALQQDANAKIQVVFGCETQTF